MLELIGTPAAAPFTIALIIMLVIAALEGVGLLFGLAISGLVDTLLPDVDLPDLEIDTPDFDTDLPDGLHAPDADLGSEIQPGYGPFSYFLSWLSFGKVPALVLLVCFLTAFGLSGLAILALAHPVLTSVLPSILAVIPALMIALPSTRYLGRTLAHIMPKEQTEAVSSASFIGRVAVISRGRARRHLPAEARVTDTHGQTHWIRVEPDLDDAVFGPGTEVLIVAQISGVYRIIENTNSHLTPGV